MQLEVVLLIYLFFNFNFLFPACFFFPLLAYVTSVVVQ